MIHLQAAHLFIFCGGRLPDDCGSWKLKANLLYFFFGGGRPPGENVTAANWIFLTFRRWQAPRWECDTCKLHICSLFRVAGAQMSVTVANWNFLTFFFCGGRLPSENVTAASWIFLIFLRWQAPSWTFLTFLLRWQAPKRKCDSCKLDMLDVFAVAGSQMSVAVKN